MASTQLQKCAVCPRETTKMCSGCKSVAFCSRECQKVLWPTHKVLCKRDPDVFYLPPLDEALVTQFLALRDKPFQGANITFEQMWGRQLGVQKEWTFILDQLRYDHDVADDPSRNLLSLFALVHLHQYGRGEKLFAPLNQEPYFQAVARLHKAVTGFLNESLAPMFGRYTRLNDPFRLLNAFLRALLVEGTMLARYPDDGSLPPDVYDVLRHALVNERARAILERMPLPQPAREAMSPGDVKVPARMRAAGSYDHMWSEMIAGRL
ncbi:hypothetical protein JCM10450v2_002874 [Rhodotorula kratochvilovae]